MVNNQFRTIKIGLVDDHRLFKSGMKVVFSYYSHFQVVLDANNGQELIEKLKYDQPDLIMLDLIMPVMGGLEVLQFMRSHYPRMKVIVLSLYNDQALIDEVKKMGAWCFLSKMEPPFRMVEEIQNCIKET